MQHSIEYTGESIQNKLALKSENAKVQFQHISSRTGVGRTMICAAEQYLRLDRATNQSLISLNLSVAGHLTVFVADSRTLLVGRARLDPVLAVVVAQLVATPISVNR